MAGCKLEFIENIRSLGHIIDNCLCDDKYINREVKVLLREPLTCVDALSVALDFCC